MFLVSYLKMPNIGSVYEQGQSKKIELAFNNYTVEEF